MDDTYTEARVRAILNCWPQIESAVEKGTILINPGAYRMSDIEDRLAAEEVAGMCPAPSVRRNKPYRIDDAGCLYLDVKEALDKAITPKNKARILAHYYYGYEYSEIALMEGDTTEGAIKVAVKRSIEKMAEWLESPKPPKSEPQMQPRDESYKRKYTSIPPYAMS